MILISFWPYNGVIITLCICWEGGWAEIGVYCEKYCIHMHSLFCKKILLKILVITCLSNRWIFARKTNSRALHLSYTNLLKCGPWLTPKNSLSHFCIIIGSVLMARIFVTAGHAYWNWNYNFCALTHWGLMMPYSVIGFVIIGSGNGLVPDDIKPLYESMLSNLQWHPLALILMRFQWLSKVFV